MKNNDVVESMTSLPVSLSSLQILLEAANADIYIEQDSKTTYRLALAFSFFLNKDVNVNLVNDAGILLVQDFTTSLEGAWIDELAGRSLICMFDSQERST